MLRYHGTQHWRGCCAVQRGRGLEAEELVDAGLGHAATNSGGRHVVESGLCDGRRWRRGRSTRARIPFAPLRLLHIGAHESHLPAVAQPCVLQKQAGAFQLQKKKGTSVRLYLEELSGSGSLVRILLQGLGEERMEACGPCHLFSETGRGGAWNLIHGLRRIQPKPRRLRLRQLDARDAQRPDVHLCNCCQQSLGFFFPSLAHWTCLVRVGLVDEVHHHHLGGEPVRRTNERLALIARTAHLCRHTKVGCAIQRVSVAGGSKESGTALSLIAPSLASRMFAALMSR